MFKFTFKRNVAFKSIEQSTVWLCLLGLFCIVGYNIATVKIKTIVGDIVDTYFVQNNLMVLLRSVALTLLLILVFGYYKEFFCKRFIANVSIKLYDALIVHTCNLESIPNTTSGKVMTHITQDVATITKGLTRIFQTLIPDIILFFSALYTIGYNSNWMLAVMILILCTIHLFITWIANDKLKNKRHKYQEELERINQTAICGIDNFEALKSYELEDYVGDKYCRSFDAYIGINKEITLRSSVTAAWSLLFTFLILFSTTVGCGYLVAYGKITLGSFFVILSLSDSIVSPVMRFNNSVKLLLNAKTNIERIYRYLISPEEPVSCESSSGTDAKIAFNQVNFSYSNGSNVLNNVTFSCVPGKCNYILGKNGCGKSTLVRLLLGLAGPHTGGITVLGRKINEWPSTELRKQIAVLAQDIILFPETIYNNITMSAPDISEDEVYSICKDIGIHDEIEQLPHKYQTTLFDGGNPLSGGQKRRIAIARTLLRKASVYIFDEPSAFLDNKQTILLRETLRKLSQNKIVMVITHNPDLIEADSNIIYL